MKCSLPPSVVYVDEAYTWRVPLAAALTLGLAMGFAKCSGLLVLAMADEDMTLSSTTILITASLNICVMLIASPAVDILANRFTARVVASIGASINVLALILASCFLSTSTYLPIIGCLLTVGFSLSYAPPLLVYSLCFNKFRTGAAGVSFAGESLGCTILPFIVTYLIDRYTVRGAMLILAGLFLHLFVPSIVLPSVIKNRETGEVLLVQGAKEPSEDHESVVYVDEAYTWRVPLAAALTLGLAMGFAKCSGLLVLAMADEDMTLSSTTILITASLNICVMLIASPAVDILANRFTARVVASIGASINVLALILASCFLSTSTYLPIIGCLLTVGFSLSYAPPLLVYSLCFNKFRTGAAGVSFAGESLSCTILPFIVTYLIDRYTVRGAMLILAELFLHLFVPSIVLPFVIKNRETGEVLLVQGAKEPSEDHERTDILTRIRKAKVFIHPLPYGISIIIIYGISTTCLVFAYFNQITSYPLLSNEHGISRYVLSWVVATQGFIEFCGRLVFGILCDRFKDSQKLMTLIISELLLGCAAIVVSILPGNLPVLVMYAVVFGIMGGPIGSLWTVIIAVLVGTPNSSRGIGLYLLNNAFFTMILLMTMGYIQFVIGYTWILRIGAIAIMIAGLIQLFFVWQKLRQIDSLQTAETEQTHYEVL